MKILGISGSPRKNSNTEFLLKHGLSIAADSGAATTLVSLTDKQLLPCQGCYYCMTHKKCRQQDDHFEEIFTLMKEADGIIVGSPVYFSSVVPHLMALLDRAGFVSRATGDFFTGKVGGPVTIARRAGHNLAFAQLLMWFFINDIIVPGSSYWNIAVAGAGGARDMAEDAEGLRTIEYFMRNVVNVIEALEQKKSKN
jgi:multimeric flavodoxin WrbA